MVRWLEKYQAAESNAEIAASGSQFFATDAATKKNRSKYGSMNSLLISYTGTQTVELELDGVVFARFNNASFSIMPEEGIFFDHIRLHNKDTGTVVAANAVRMRWARAIAIGE